jgi:hypothetical protein
MKKVWVRTADGTEFGQITLDELLYITTKIGVDFDIDRNVATVYCDPDELEDSN